MGLREILHSDPVSRAFDAAFSEDEKAVHSWMQQNAPEMLEGSPAVVKARIRDEARLLNAERVKANNSPLHQAATKVLGNNYLESIPTSTAQIPLAPGSGVTLDTVPGLVGMSEQDWLENPASAGAALGGVAASTLPGGTLVSKLAAKAPGQLGKVLATDALLGGGTATKWLTRAEQVMLPAFTAGAAGGTADLIMSLNGVDKPGVMSDQEHSQSHVFADAFDRARQEALFEGGGGAAVLAATLGIRGGAKWLRGSKQYFDDALEAMRLAKIRGEQITLADVSNNALISSSGSTLGVMPIPIVKSRFEKARYRRSEAVTEAADNLFWNVSPEFALVRRVFGSDPAEHDRLLRFFQSNTFQQMENAVELYRRQRKPTEAKLSDLLRREEVESAAGSFRATVMEKVTDLQRQSNVPMFMKKEVVSPEKLGVKAERAKERVRVAREKLQDAQTRLEAATEEHSFAQADTRTDPTGLAASDSAARRVELQQRRIQALYADLLEAKPGSSRERRLTRQLEYATQDLEEFKAAMNKKDTQVGVDTPAAARVRSSQVRTDMASVRVNRLKAEVDRLEGQYNDTLLQTAHDRAPKELLENLDPDVADFLDRASSYGGEPLPINQLINMKSQISLLLDRKDLSKQDIAILSSLKVALESDVTSAIKAHGSPELQKLYTDLQMMDADWLTLLKGAAGQRAQQVRTSFGMQKRSEATGETFGLDPEVDRHLQRSQGPLDMDGFLDAMVGNASPEEIRHFALFMRTQGEEGKQALRFAAARALDRVIEPATVMAKDDPKLVAILGQKIDDLISGGDPRSEQAQRFWALIDSAGVDRAEVRGFTKAAQILWREMPPQASRFVLRSFIMSLGKDPGRKMLRLMTAGIMGASASGAGAATLGAAGGALPAMMSIFFLDRYSRITTSPRTLASVRAILDPKYGTQARFRAAERLVADNIFRDWLSEQTPTEAIESGADMMNQFGNGISNPATLTRMANEYFNNNPGSSR